MTDPYEDLYITACDMLDAINNSDPDPEMQRITFLQAQDALEEGVKACRNAESPITGWQPIETAPTHCLHVRGLWVSATTGEPLYWQADAGIVDRDGDFVSREGAYFGLRDHTHWMPLPPPPPAEEADND